MMKELCSFMFGGHTKCKETIHSLESQMMRLLNQIQELKAINDYQAFDLEKKIKELMQDNIALGDERNEYEQRYLRSDEVASNLDEVLKRRDQEIENFNKGTQCLLNDNKRLTEENRLLRNKIQSVKKVKLPKLEYQ